MVSIQEQQLLNMGSNGEAERPDVAAMLPRWRHETLRQYELRLRAQLAAKEATAEFQRVRGTLKEQARCSEAARQVGVPRLNDGSRCIVRVVLFG